MLTHFNTHLSALARERRDRHRWSAPCASAGARSLFNLHPTSHILHTIPNTPHPMRHLLRLTHTHSLSLSLFLSLSHTHSLSLPLSLCLSLSHSLSHTLHPNLCATAGVRHAALRAPRRRAFGGHGHGGDPIAGARGELLVTDIYQLRQTVVRDRQSLATNWSVSVTFPGWFRGIQNQG
jgi:hypothetical protein